MRNILVGTDFSDISMRALDHALGLARAFDASVHIAHAVPLLRYALGHEAEPTDPTFELKLKAELTQRLKDIARNNPLQGKPLAVTLADGSPARVIPDLADKLSSDLIVIGTHGHTGFQHLVLGSVAERIVRSAKVPVLTVH
jgi:nucleotide-binding universal stress UspA family protein